MRCLRLIGLIFALATTLAASAFEGLVRNITLDEAILMARANSVDAAVALNELRKAYWSYRTYRADLLPEVNLNATVPSYRKSYSTYQHEDGYVTRLCATM